MNADILRLILFLGGVGLILGIYFWDRHKKINSRVHAIKKAQFESASQLRDMDIADDPVEVTGIDPADNLDSSNDEDIDDSMRQMDIGDLASDDIDQALGDLDQMVRSDSAPTKPKRGKQSSFSFTADDQNAEFDADIDSDLPVLILQLNIVATHKDGFAGNAILRASKEVDLEYGDFNIFHRFADPAKKGPVMFSMASMVEPGIFTLKEMSTYSTPGLTLFCQLPGPKDGVALFSDMLFTAERLAALLQGELQDETHSVLSKQTIEHLRESVLEHGRQVQLVRSKKARRY